MNDIDEGRLRFKFADGWAAIKFDDTDWHKVAMKSRLKAMDILATSDQKHWWIEIKDCQTFEPENRPRLAAVESVEVETARIWIKANEWEKIVKVERKKLFIIDEVVAKLQDTVFSLVIASRTSCPELAPFLSAVAGKENLTVVLLLTWDITDFKRFAKLLHQKLSMALTPYGLQGLIVNEITSIPGLDYKISIIP